MHRNLQRTIMIASIAIVMLSPSISDTLRPTGSQSVLAYISAGFASVAQAEEPSATIVINPTAIDFSVPEIINPLRGLYRWRGNETVPSPSPLSRISYDSYDRYEWNDLEKGEGEYDFSALERTIAKAASEGRKHSFRIRVLIANEGSGVPEYVMAKLEKGWWSDTNKDGKSDTYVPDWNDPDFLSGVERLLQALGKTYNNDPRVSFMDIGIFGSYGEWHTYGFSYPQSNGAVSMSRPNRHKLIDYHLAAFPDKHLVMMTDDEESLVYALQQSPRVGWRRDSLGVEHFSSIVKDLTKLGADKLLLFEERWKTAPVITEFMNKKYHKYPDTFYTAKEQVERYHVSMVGNGNTDQWSTFDQRTQDAFVEVGKASGYRFALKQATISATFSAGEQIVLESTWLNEGVAPSYDKWEVYYQLRDRSTGEVVWEVLSQTNLSTLLPTAESGPVTIRDTAKLPRVLNQGSYDFNVIVRDPATYRKPMALAIAGVQSDGSYQLTTINVAQSTARSSLENNVYLPLILR